MYDSKSDVRLLQLFLAFMASIAMLCGYLCYTCSDWDGQRNKKEVITQPKGELKESSKAWAEEAWEVVNQAENLVLENLELLQALWNYLMDRFVDDPDLRDLLKLGDELKRDFDSADDLKKHIYRAKSKEMLERLLERDPKVEHEKGKTYF